MIKYWISRLVFYLDDKSHVFIIVGMFLLISYILFDIFAR